MRPNPRNRQAAWARALAATFVAGTWLLVACGGGSEPGSIDGLGPTPGEPNVPGNPSGGDNPYDIDGVPSTGVTVTTAGGGSTGSCYACVDYLSGIPFDGSSSFCPGADLALSDLLSCACTLCDVDCTGPCGGAGEPPDAACQSCASNSCTTEYSACASN